MQAQEIRRQAMLAAMEVDVWLPRVQLPEAGVSRDYLLEWGLDSCGAEVQPRPVTAEAKAGAKESGTPTAQTVHAVAGPAVARQTLEQIRQVLAAPKHTQPPAIQPDSTEDVQDAAEQVQEQQVQPQEIPRFSLQLLRSGTCLILLDLPVGEALQSRDPEYLLLKDILRAAGLSPEPSMLRNAEPVRWPLLTTGSLVQKQDEEAARSYVRELLTLECSQKATSFVWLLGENSTRFACQADSGAEPFALLAFEQQTRFWALPSLEQLMQRPDLKRELWQGMQKIMARWSTSADG